MKWKEAADKIKHKITKLSTFILFTLFFNYHILFIKNVLSIVIIMIWFYVYYPKEGGLLNTRQMSTTWYLLCFS